MKTKKITIMLIAFCLFFASARAEDAQSPKSSDMRYVEAILTITTDPQIFSMDSVVGDVQDLVDMFLLSPEVIRESFDRAENVSFLTLDAPRHVGGLQTTRKKVIFYVNQDDLPQAGEFVRSFADHLKDKLKTYHESQMKIFGSRYGVFIEGVSRAQAVLAELQERQNDISGDISMDKQSVLQRQMEHRHASIENSLQQSILKNRLKEISQEIANIHDEVQIKIENDEILKQLEGLLAQQENEFKLIEKTYETGGLAQSEMDRFREKLIRTKIELAQRKEQIRNEGSGEMLRELNRQLRETTARLQELEIQEQVLAGTDPGSLSKSTDYEILEVKINAAKENLHNAIMEKNAYERQMNLIQPPDVHVEYISYTTQPSEAN